ncbi:chorismate mutase [Curtobacterium sp. VKM Ac-2922]|uniref:chorismate mutase n=1 Tax=Curtobacterium sp. VKM Ac-2922 TaxID=2929475 RepID=UPI001FB3522C|nr:chorismate mutase [Curtobacterium sp. VKM Ac-2922]MCJ1714766.1 chorismate mutase [Curtobacterium sp. VKM Ac-2922]
MHDRIVADGLAAVRPLVLARLRLAGRIAEHKWLLGLPISDPERERAVLDRAEAAASCRGHDPAIVARVVGSQIDASKFVQRALFTRWTDDPWTAPTVAADIRSLRRQVTAIDDALVDAVGAAAAIADDPGCAARVRDEQERPDDALDAVHRTGLRLAWAAFCRR